MSNNARRARIQQQRRHRSNPSSVSASPRSDASEDGPTLYDRLRALPSAAGAITAEPSPLAYYEACETHRQRVYEMRAQRATQRTSQQRRCVTGCALCDLGSIVYDMTRLPGAANGYCAVLKCLNEQCGVTSDMAWAEHVCDTYDQKMYQPPEVMARYGLGPMPRMTPADVLEHVEEHTVNPVFQQRMMIMRCTRMMNLIEAKALRGDNNLDHKSIAAFEKIGKLWLQIATTPGDKFAFASGQGGVAREMVSIDRKRVGAIANLHAFERFMVTMNHDNQPTNSQQQAAASQYPSFFGVNNALPMLANTSQSRPLVR